MTYTPFLLLTLVACQNMPAPLEQQHKEANTSLLVQDTAKSEEVIYRSTDKGATWAPFAAGLPPDARVSGFATKGNKIFASTDRHGVFVTQDGLNDWKAINR